MPNRVFALLILLSAAVFGFADGPPVVEGGAQNDPRVPSFGLPSAPQNTFNNSRDRVKITIKPASMTVAQGEKLPIAVIFDIDPTWHIWSDDRPTPKGFATFSGAQYTTIDVVSEPTGAINKKSIAIQWPDIHAAEANLGEGPAKYAVFDGKAIAYVLVPIPLDAPIGATTLNFALGIQACNATTCMFPATAEDAVSIEVVAAGEATTGTRMPAGDDADFANFKPDAATVVPPAGAGNSNSTVKFDFFGLITFDLNAAGAGFVLLLLVAAIGGVLLNFTPCVLPVIPLKIMGLSSAAGSRRRTFMLGTIMSLGVVSLWLAIGAGLAAITGFTSTNQLFQFPAFSLGIGLFIALMAVGMCGLFSIRLPKFVYGINPSHESAGGSFMFGIMTGILALPCIGPFMGAAAAFAANLAPVQTLLVFTSIGVGMALPYQILSTFPNLVNKMPRTGPASELIKQVMGLLMLAAAAYFIGTGISGFISDGSTAPSRIYLWFVAAFGVAAGVWLLWKTIKIAKKPVNKVIFSGLGVIIAAISLWIGVHFTSSGPINWVYYTPERFAAAKDEGKIVVMEFTAEWCINCKALEAAVLHTDRVADLLDDIDVVPIKVDLTGNNKAGNDMLKAVDRVGIPLLVVFRPDGTEIFKGDFYTVDQVIQAVNEARQSGQVALRSN